MNLDNIGSTQLELTCYDTDDETIVILFSYNTPLAILKDDIVYRTKQFFSNTSSKHLNRWLSTLSDEVKIIVLDQSEIDSLVHKL